MKWGDIAAHLPKWHGMPRPECGPEFVQKTNITAKTLSHISHVYLFTQYISRLMGNHDLNPAKGYLLKLHSLSGRDGATTLQTKFWFWWRKHCRHLVPDSHLLGERNGFRFDLMILWNHNIAKSLNIKLIVTLSHPNSLPKRLCIFTVQKLVESTVEHCSHDRAPEVGSFRISSQLLWLIGVDLRLGQNVVAEMKWVRCAADVLQRASDPKESDISWCSGLITLNQICSLDSKILFLYFGTLVLHLWSQIVIIHPCFCSTSLTCNPAHHIRHCHHFLFRWLTRPSHQHHNLLVRFEQPCQMVRQAFTCFGGELRGGTCGASTSYVHGQNGTRYYSIN